MPTFVNEDKLLRTSDYPDHFDSEFYLKTLCSDVASGLDKMPFLTFFIETTVQILCNKKKCLGNKKALEFGGDPSI